MMALDLRIQESNQQQNVEIEALKERLEEVNSTLHRRVSGVDEDVEKLQENVIENSTDISYLNGKIENICLP